MIYKCINILFLNYLCNKARQVEIRDKFDLSFDFRTNSKNGILAIISDSYSNDCFFIELYDSQLKATLYIDGEPDSAW
jgi:hypothetical protein